MSEAPGGSIPLAAPSVPAPAPMGTAEPAAPIPTPTPAAAPVLAALATSATALSVVPSPRPSRPSSPTAASPISALPTGGPSGGGGGAAAAYRPLNVRDALQYLDRVKQQFSAEFEVYGKFLTIMKDFKTQNIDTPGVIDRVSTLFRGHPSLIQGFNTFLPPGYRIECVVSTTPALAGSGQGASNTITVTTPMGVTTRTQDVTGSEAMEFVRNQPGARGPQSTDLPPLPTTGRTSSIPPPTSAAPIGKERETSTPASTSTAGHLPSTSKPSNYNPLLASVLPALPSLPSRSSSPSVVAIPPYRGKTSVPSMSSQLAQQARNNADPFSSRPPQQQQYRQGPTLEEEINAARQLKAAAKLEAQQAAERENNVEAMVQGAQSQSQSQGTSNDPNSNGNGPTPVMEFNHAINYVNKIKNRFTKDPETYKTFLEILQTYQKETRPIQEVYTQVTALFHGAPDLLDEFKAFLPDVNDGAGQAALNRGNPNWKPKKQAEEKSGRQASGSGKVIVEEKKKRAAPGMGERAKAKRAKTNHTTIASPQSPPPASFKPDRNSSRTEHNQYNQPTNASSSNHHQSQSQSQNQNQNQNQNHNPEPAPPVSYHPQPYGAPPPGFPGAPRMQSAYDSYLAHHRAPTLVQADEFSFFDRVKKYLDDRTTWTEFLKLLNLFTQEIIDVATLLEKSLGFIGGNDELVGAFKELVGWDTVVDGRVEGEDWVIDNEPVLERPKVELHSMKSFGPSYRKLPDSEIDLACSGRDALDWSVLNDEWVAFATWASEGSGAHRKNIYEDALYNSEQERHWYSFQIESNLRTIAHFEPIAARIVLMSSEERAQFRLEEGFGGDSPSIYERIVKKIYGRDQGDDILQALFDNPSVAVPIVLSRLKQKDEEWKRAEREWNKVWREVDAKNYYRSLDHQAIPFKATDKKTTTTSKSLTTEIENLRRDKQHKIFDRDPDATPLRPHHQFEFGMPDRDVLFDVLKLCFSFLDRDQSGTSAPERARVEAYLRLFIPLLFGVPHSDMEANLAHSDEQADNEEEENESEAGGASDAESSNGAEATSTAPSNGVQKNGTAANKKGGAADLRKRLLTHAATTAARNGRSIPSTNGVDDNSTPGPTVLGEQTWIQLSEATDGEEMVCDEPMDTRRFHFFANSTLYCLVRIIQTLYHRLLDFKQLAAELAAEGTRRLSPLAIELGLSTPVPVIDQGDNPAEHYYEHALDLAEKLFDGDLDQTTYEEQLRYMGGTKAYPLFTIDKLISTVIKHIHTVNSDSKCQDLVTLLEKDRAKEFTTPRQQIAYRMEAEAAIGSEESLYRIEWIPEEKTLTMQLLGKDDLTLDDAYGSEQKMHSSWVASYALMSATEGVGARVDAPLLKRNRMLSAAEDPQEFDLTPGLEVTVASDSYELKFVAKTEDYLHRRRTEAVEYNSAQVNETRSKRFNAWLQRGERGPSPTISEVAMDLLEVAVEAEAGDDVPMEV